MKKGKHRCAKISHRTYPFLVFLTFNDRREKDESMICLLIREKPRIKKTNVFPTLFLIVVISLLLLLLLPRKIKWNQENKRHTQNNIIKRWERKGQKRFSKLNRRGHWEIILADRKLNQLSKKSLKRQRKMVLEVIWKVEFFSRRNSD